jgi:uncharacterized membrane protein YoaT (DUF817 family)
MRFLSQLWTFGYKQALCCIFPVTIFLTLAISKYLHIPYRYDFILVVCMVVQALLVYTKQETIYELKVISLFHMIGLLLELFKVHQGSWAYPEYAFTKIASVPIYSGFMYSSVASYLCQAWRRFDLRFHNWPPIAITFTVAAVIYLNFFVHHYLLDARWLIIASLLVVFRKSFVTFYVNTTKYRMNIIVSYFLIGLFIWLAENIATFFGAWQYPSQQKYWQMVHLSKISSWFLLVIISIIVVANLKHIKYPKEAALNSENIPEEDIAGVSMSQILPQPKSD